MKQTKSDTELIAKCGLYCGACGKYQKGKCAGCLQNEKASWCKVRSCCLENGYASCADCTQYSDVMACKKYDNFMAKLFGLIFNSDRAACIDAIRQNGYEQFAASMAREGRMTFKRSR